MEGNLPRLGQEVDLKPGGGGRHGSCGTAGSWGVTPPKAERGFLGEGGDPYLSSPESECPWTSRLQPGARPPAQKASNCMQKGGRVSPTCPGGPSPPHPQHGLFPGTLAQRSLHGSVVGVLRATPPHPAGLGKGHLGTGGPRLALYPCHLPAAPSRLPAFAGVEPEPRLIGRWAGHRSPTPGTAGRLTGPSLAPALSPNLINTYASQAPEAGWQALGPSPPPLHLLGS